MTWRCGVVGRQFVWAAVLAFLAGCAGSHAGSSTSSAGIARLEHVVVIFQENESFDHYFGTYPHAANPPGEPPFVPTPGTPSIDGLTPELIGHNPNGVSPQRLSRGDWPLCSPSHEYDPALREWDRGRMDQFVRESIDYERSDDVRDPARYGLPHAGVTGGVTGPDCTAPLKGHEQDQDTNKEVMDYYDGNTVTALWNYAQHGVLFDHFFDAQFGPSTPGAINLVSDRTSGVSIPPRSDDAHLCSDTGWVVDQGKDCTAPPGTPGLFSGDTDVRNGTMIGDPDPAYDDCSATNTVAMTGPNVGDLLTKHHVTWGWFSGGFRPTTPASATSPAICAAEHQPKNESNQMAAQAKKDYIVHHEPFQYYQSIANPHHLPPTSVNTIGQSDQANHQYDLADFLAAARANNLPRVSFLKAPGYQEGHTGYSDPIDEQRFVVDMVNAVERSAQWNSTAIVITFDDAGGFYDHVAPPILTADREAVAGPVIGGVPWAGNACLPDEQPQAQRIVATGRCGPGFRLPMIILSPWVTPNTVEHSLADQTSVLRLIEDHFAAGERLGQESFDARAASIDGVFTSAQPHFKRLILDPDTGQPAP